MIQIKVLLLLAVLAIANCGTVPEQPSSQPAADPTTANPVPEVSKEPLKQPHTHEEHPADNPDHSDHPGHENDPKPVKVPKHHEGDHVHDEKCDDEHDHKQHTEQPEVKKENLEVTPEPTQEEKPKPTQEEKPKPTEEEEPTPSQEEKPKPTQVEEVKESDNETQEARFKRGLWRRRLD